MERPFGMESSNEQVNSVTVHGYNATAQGYFERVQGPSSQGLDQLDISMHASTNNRHGHNTPPVIPLTQIKEVESLGYESHHGSGDKLQANSLTVQQFCDTVKGEHDVKEDPERGVTGMKENSSGVSDTDKKCSMDSTNEARLSDVNLQASLKLPANLQVAPLMQAYESSSVNAKSISGDVLDTSRKYKCKECGKSYKRGDGLKTHMRTHTGEKPFVCKTCGKSFSDRGCFARHKRIHSGDKPYKCDICGKDFTQSDSLTKHQRVHTGEKPFTCGVCGKSFSCNSNLNGHKRVHTGEKPFKCEVCGKAFTENGSLKVHRRIHSGEKPFKCEVCEKAFTIKDTLIKHQRIHTGDKPFTCDVCKKSFSDSRNLMFHSRVHTGEKPHKCEICGKAFPRSTALAQHKRTHSGEKPYSCEWCGRPFADRSSLSRHFRLHTGIRPYHCSVCGQSFVQKNHVRKHQNKVPACSARKADDSDSQEMKALLPDAGVSHEDDLEKEMSETD